MVKIRFGLILCVVIAAVAAIVGLIAGFFNAVSPLADSLSHFRAHFSGGLLVAGVVLLGLRAGRSGAAALVAALTGFATMYPAMPGLARATNGPSDFKLIQFNAMMHNPRRAEAIAWLGREQPDVLALQEIGSKTIEIYDAMAKTMPSQTICGSVTGERVAILSKFPKLAEKCVDKSGLVWMQVNVGGKPVTLASLHLSWPYPYGQWKHVERLRQEVEAMPRPVILAGDFNAAPWSESVQKLQALSGTQIAPGFRLTLKMKLPLLGITPVLPIDHVLLDPTLRANDTRVGPSIGSDHLPVVMRIGS